MKQIDVTQNQFTNSELEQIEEMAKVIKSSMVNLGCGNFNFTGDEISTMFAKALCNAGYRKQNVGICVDKDELIKALKYDRDQFEIGYARGYDIGYRDANRSIADRVLVEFEMLVNRAFSKYEEKSGDRVYFKPMYRTHAETEIFAIISELRKKYTEGLRYD